MKAVFWVLSAGALASAALAAGLSRAQDEVVASDSGDVAAFSQKGAKPASVKAES